MNSKYSGNLELFRHIIYISVGEIELFGTLMGLRTKSASHEYTNKSASTHRNKIYPSAEFYTDVVSEIVQHLYDFRIRVTLNEVRVCVTKDNILKATVTFLVKEAMVDNFL